MSLSGELLVDCVRSKESVIPGTEGIPLEDPHQICINGMYPFLGRVYGGLFDTRAQDRAIPHEHLHAPEAGTLQDLDVPFTNAVSDVEREQLKKRARTFGIAALATITLAGVEVGVEALKYRAGLQTHNLSLRDALHNIPDTALYGSIFSAAALKLSESKEDITRLKYRASKILEEKISPGALIVGGVLNTVHATYMLAKGASSPLFNPINLSRLSPNGAMQKLSELQAIEFFHSPLIVAAGNLAIAGVIYNGTKSSTQAIDVGGKKHSFNDAIKTSLQVVATMVSGTVDNAIGVVFNIRDAAIGLRMRSDQRRKDSTHSDLEDDIDHTHHGHDHSEHQQSHVSAVSDAPNAVHHGHDHGHHDHEHEHGPTCIHDHHELLSETRSGRLIERTLNFFAPKNEHGKRKPSVPVAFSLAILATVGSVRMSHDDSAGERKQADVYYLSKNTGPHNEMESSVTIGKYPTETNGTVWGISQNNLEDFLGHEPTDIQTHRLTRYVLDKNNLSWEEAKLLREETTLSFPNATELEAIVGA